MIHKRAGWSGLEEEINNELSNKLNFIKLHNLFLLDNRKLLPIVKSVENPFLKDGSNN